jgi:hypothetical protein
VHFQLPTWKEVKGEKRPGDVAQGMRIKSDMF